jgi:hypothetical protein
VPSLFARIDEALRPLVGKTAYREIAVPPELDEARFLARETGFELRSEVRLVGFDESGVVHPEASSHG